MTRTFKAKRVAVGYHWDWRSLVECLFDGYALVITAGGAPIGVALSNTPVKLLEKTIAPSVALANVSTSRLPEAWDLAPLTYRKAQIGWLVHPKYFDFPPDRFELVPNPPSNPGGTHGRL